MAIIKYMYGKNQECLEGDEQNFSSAKNVQVNRRLKKLMVKTGLSELEIRSNRKYRVMLMPNRNKKSVLKNRPLRCVS